MGVPAIHGSSQTHVIGEFGANLEIRQLPVSAVPGGYAPAAV